MQAAGPWLIGLDQEPAATDKLFAFLGNKPASVFWACDGGEATLYRHLRTIAMVRVPIWAADGKEAPGHLDDRTECKTVFFRYFDPRVLGALLPCLDAAQFSRIIGPAQEIAFSAPFYGDLRRVVADKTWPAASPGMLVIRSEQAEAVIGRRSDASRRRIAAYLREHAPEMTERATDQQLFDFVVESEIHGRALGLESEAAHRRWTYLMLRSEKRILRAPAALQFIRQGDSSPDEQMEILLRQTAIAMHDAELRHGWRDRK